jgi:glycosyltransferase involved in cell wall biosynthesis
MGNYLEKTILSVLENLDLNDEYIIVDGDSTDNSIDIINKYLDRITLIREKDQGYADAINKGFSLAKNQYYCWINSGDLLLNGSIQKARNLLNNGYDLVYGNDIHIDENGNVISYSYGKAFNFHNFMLFSGWTPLQDACFWNADIYWKINGIDKNYKYAADFDFFLRLSKDAKIFYSNTFFSAFRRHFGQKSISGVLEYTNERKCSQIIQLNLVHISCFKLYVNSLFYFLLLRFRTFLFIPLLRLYFKLKFK